MCIVALRVVVLLRVPVIGIRCHSLSRFVLLLNATLLYIHLINITLPRLLTVPFTPHDDTPSPAVSFLYLISYT
ncbi:hypothetical protein BGW80DRAFT_367075 [Lactifluus volemus]|nr:hypothetical protein BGW80DRAFT_367075 [Lactifluus volemus]